MRRQVAAGCAAWALAVAAMTAAIAGAEPSRPEQHLAGPEYSGGATTVFANGRTAFSFPAANLAEEERTRFVIGNSFFRRNWVQAPASTKARDGLGPHFIARSCGGCHVQDGRGPPPRIVDGVNVEEPVALLMRLSIPGTTTDGGPNPEPVYGDQLNNAAVQGVKPEGRVIIRTRPVTGSFADGATYELQAPTYGFTNLGYGSMRDDVMTSPRLAPQLIGVGLLEAIDESEILANAARQARDPGPIKGVPNYAWDVCGERRMLGRFGWKANVATLAHQSASAFVGDIGITSSRFTDEACTRAQADCRAAPRGEATVRRTRSTTPPSGRWSSTPPRSPRRRVGRSTIQW